MYPAMSELMKPSIDIRLGFATRLLVDSAHTIAEICYDCGFNNLSNFNRLFEIEAVNGNLLLGKAFQGERIT